MADKEVAFLPHWLTKGEEDPFPHYLERDRSDLPMADFSDDALGNYLFMNYDRTVDEDVAIIMAIGRGDKTEHVSRIMMATAVKERLRWLSRRVMVLEGTYPGTTPKVTVEEAQTFPEQERRAWERLEENLPLFYKAFDMVPDQVRIGEVSDIVHALITDRVYDEDKLTSTLRPRQDQYVRAWHQYVQLILTLARYGKFIPFVGDEIAKAGKNKAVVARSRYHASGQFVNYPVGVVHPVVLKMGQPLLNEKLLEIRPKGVVLNQDKARP